MMNRLRLVCQMELLTFNRKGNEKMGLGTALSE